MRSGESCIAIRPWRLGSIWSRSESSGGASNFIRKNPSRMRRPAATRRRSPICARRRMRWRARPAWARSVAWPAAAACCIARPSSCRSAAPASRSKSRDPQVAEQFARVGAAGRRRPVAAGSGGRSFGRADGRRTAPHDPPLSPRPGPALLDPIAARLQLRRCKRCGPKSRRRPPAARTRSSSVVAAADGRTSRWRSTIAAPATRKSNLLPVDCELLTDDLLTRTLERLRPSRTNAASRPTLLLENLERMPAAHQSLLLAAIRQNAMNARIIATIDRANIAHADDG